MGSRERDGMKFCVLQPHGFCAGVTSALRKAEDLLSSSVDTENFYCLHELVHNELVIENLTSRGLKFVESLSLIPNGATVLFSAHGVSPEVRKEALEKGLKIVDATCPFVTKVHRAASLYASQNIQVVILGHPNHVEVRGILGEATNAWIIQNREEAEELICKHPTMELGVVSQTTMNADEVSEIIDILKTHFKVTTEAEVCHATKERQDAVKSFKGDALLVLGSPNSSNTNRLCEIAPCLTFRAGTIDEVKSLNFEGIKILGVTSGASTPENYFNEVLSYLHMRFEKEEI